MYFKYHIYSERSKTVNRGVILNTALESQFMAVLGIEKEDPYGNHKACRGAT